MKFKLLIFITVLFLPSCVSYITEDNTGNFIKCISNNTKLYSTYSYNSKIVATVNFGTLMKYNNKKAYNSFFGKNDDEFYCVDYKGLKNLWISTKYSIRVFHINDLYVYKESNLVNIESKFSTNKITCNIEFFITNFGNIYILETEKGVYIINKNNVILTNLYNYGFNEISLSGKYCYFSYKTYYDYDSLLILSDQGKIIFETPTRHIYGWINSNSIKFTIDFGIEAPNLPIITNNQEIYVEDVVWNNGVIEHLSNYRIETKLD